MSKQKKNNRGNKKGKENSKAKSINEMKLDEPIVQDRICGFKVKDIAERHGLTSDQVSRIIAKHKDDILQRREEYLKQRQEEINLAFENDCEQMAELITKTGRLMSDSVDMLQGEFKRIKDADKKDTGLALKAIRVCSQIFKELREITLNQQKAAQDSE